MMRVVVEIDGLVSKKALKRFFSKGIYWRTVRKDYEENVTIISCGSEAAAKRVARYFWWKRSKVKCINSGQ